MAGKLHHEQIYRGAEQVARLGALRVALCGAGALGSNLADNLVRQGFARLRVIDDDRIEEHNVGTQLYGESEVGLWKVEALRNRIFRAVGVEIEAVRKRFGVESGRGLLKEVDLVIDTFDNSESRRLVQEECRRQQVACVHAALAADYCEVIWDEHYRVPAEVAGDVCDYPMARNLVLLAVAVASETVVRFALRGERGNWSATLGDLAIGPLDVSSAS